MRKKLQGFTLAEILITVGIIGVIAAVTLPALTLNITKQQVPSQLAKAINTLELANKTAIQEGSVRNLIQLTSDNTLDTLLEEYFSTVIKPYARIQEEATTVEYRTFNLSGVEISNSSIKGKVVYTTPDSISYFVINDDVLENVINTNQGQGYGNSAIGVYIDANGWKKGPNAIGKDLFKVYVDIKGAVLPFGGLQYKDYDQATTAGKVLWETGCSSKTSMPSNPTSCSGSVIDNGNKIIYY